MDCTQTHRLTYRQGDGHKKVKVQKTDTAVVNADPSGTEYLYYTLDVEDIILKNSLLPALR